MVFSVSSLWRFAGRLCYLLYLAFFGFFFFADFGSFSHPVHLVTFSAREKLSFGLLIAYFTFGGLAWKYERLAAVLATMVWTAFVGVVGAWTSPWLLAGYVPLVFFFTSSYTLNQQNNSNKH